MPTQYKYKTQVWALGGVLAVLLGSYIFFLSQVVYNTLGRQQAERQIAELTSSLSQVEFQYLADKSKVNPELARSLGFVEASQVVIAKRTDMTTAYVSKSEL